MEWTLRITPPRFRLIINADDLGVSPERDAGILDCFTQGAISSASLLVDGEHAAEAAQQAVDAGLPLGLHLNLTEGSRPQRSTLTGADGALLGKFGLRDALAAGRIRNAELACEIRRQFDRFIELTGELPSHVDGHHHSHVEPAIAAVLAPIMASEYGVYCVRLPREQGLGALPGDMEFEADFQRDVVRATHTSAAIFAAAAVYSTDYFLGQSLMGRRLQADRARTLLNQIQAQGHSETWVELMVHPGMPATSPACSAFCRSPARAHEMAVLQSVAWQDATADWQPGSYRDLPRRDADEKPGLLIYSKLIPATGNAETARRYAAACSTIAQVRFRPLPAAEAQARESIRLQEFAAREHLDLALGIHLYRAGRALADTFSGTGMPPLPFGLLASGTDANADIDDQARTAAMGSALAAADFLLCLTESQKPRLQALGLPDDTIVLGNGIDVETSSRFSLRDALGLVPETKLILFPAGLRRLKGVLPAIEELAAMLSERYPTHVLVVLGPALEADYAEVLRHRIDVLCAQHPGLCGRILLNDGLPHADYLAALREADLVLNASEHEGLSHGLAEAMAAGIPVLARDIAGNRLLVRNQENGRLFDSFAQLPRTYAECFDAAETTAQLAARARIDIAAAYPAEAEQCALRAVVERCLKKRQTTLTLASGSSLRLDLAPGTHPLSAENIGLFARIAFSPEALQALPPTLDLVMDAGCGCGVFGFMLLDALATQGRRVQRMCFADPHQPSLAALARTLTRHRRQLPMLEEASLSTGALLSPLLATGQKAALICANLPQTPGPVDFRLDRYGGSDGADLICALIAELPKALAADGECFLLHISLAHPARVQAALAAIGFTANVIAEQTRQAQFADYAMLHPELPGHLRSAHATGRSEFTRDADGKGFTYRARLLRLRQASTQADTARASTRCDNIADR
mgnify:CR=1 FL=1